MGAFAVKILINAVAIWVATLVVPGINTAEGRLVDEVGTLLLVGLMFGVVNAVIKPVVKLLALPLYLLTLGLITFVVNAVMLMIVSWISGAVGVDFEITDFFPDALLAAVVVTFVSLVLALVLPDGD